MKVAPICHLWTLTSHFYTKPVQYVPFLTKTNQHRNKTKRVDPFYKVFTKFPTAKQKQSLLQGKHFQSKRDCLHTPLFSIVEKLCFPTMNCKAIERVTNTCWTFLSNSPLHFIFFVCVNRLLYPYAPHSLPQDQCMLTEKAKNYITYNN